jgi:hypothetical protein
MLFAEPPKLSCFEARKQRKLFDTLTFKSFYTRPYENICKIPKYTVFPQTDNMCISQTAEYSGSSFWDTLWKTSGSFHKKTP